MKLIFKKGYTGDVNTLPSREVEGATPFKEPESIEKFSLIANLLGLFILVAAAIPVLLTALSANNTELTGDMFFINFIIGAVLSVLSMPVHELLHAICFRGEVEFYSALKRGVLFVVGTESMTKARFVFMSMLPNLVFGFLPYILFFIFPNLIFLGILGAFCIAAGAGDYINVFNALTQMPKGALCFMSKNRSYWYIPKD